MAMLYNAAMLDPPPTYSPSNGPANEEVLAGLFRAGGWSVERTRASGADVLIRKGQQYYAVELKSSAEGRADRVIPLLAQAILEARSHARGQAGATPLAVVHVGRLTAVLRDKAARFQAEYAPDVAIGLIGREGGRWFVGKGLEAMSVESDASRAGRKRPAPKRTHDLFSDLNQWLLKVLLAPELPERLLRAPRREYRTAAELAQAAQVSAMSVSRLVRRLREDGFLDESSAALRLVRRAELFRRWQSAAMRVSPELRMAYLVPAGGAGQLHKLASRLEACVGLFAAADLLQLGHVSGTVPYLYARRLSPPHGADWPGVAPAAPGEPPQVILKQSNAPESLFRGAIRVGDILVADVLQIWLDVSAHPSRGAEQADVLRHGVLKDVLGREA